MPDQARQLETPALQTKPESGTGIPLYQQIFVIFRDKILAGEFAPGDKLMTEQEICAAFGVSRITAKQALNQLADEGLVVRRRGHGTKVIHHARPPVMKASIDGLLENVGFIGRTTAVEVLEFGYVPAGRDIAEALQVSPGASVQRAVRVRHLERDSMSFLVTHVPERIGALIEGQDMSRTPLLLLLEEAGVPVAAAKQAISATVADAPVATALNVPAGAPLIEVRRIVFDTDDRPVEHIRILYKPEHYQFEMALQRVQSDAGKRWSSVS